MSLKTRRYAEYCEKILQSMFTGLLQALCLSYGQQQTFFWRGLLIFDILRCLKLNAATHHVDKAYGNTHIFDRQRR